MKFSKIVITGGPCAGKTTGLSFIEENLSKYGYKVVFLNESATELITNNLGYNAYDDNYTFEKNIIQLQMAKERLYEEACRKLPNDKVVLLLDRGVMDSRSYMSEDEYERFLRSLDTSTIDLRDNYDAVFHLVTAAKGAEDFYTLANNQARKESLDEAREADTRTMNCWVGHPHFRAIDNSTSFDNKLKRLLNEIISFLGEPEPFEIEKKYLIKMPDIKYLDSLPNCTKVEIIQTYLNSLDKAEEVRVRQRGIDGHYIYTQTVKKRISATKRLETERRISEREYLKSLLNADTKYHQIKKTRYCIMHDNRYFEIDIYPFSTDYAILEIELLDEKEKVAFPDFIRVIKEVTDDESYSNRSLAKSYSLLTKKSMPTSSTSQITFDTMMTVTPIVEKTIFSNKTSPIKKRLR